LQYPTTPDRLHDDTVRRHWEAARKVDITGRTVTFDPDGPMADVAWAKQRLARATQALPNGYCGLPLQKSCPHANACLTCPMFLTTSEFLPQHRAQRHQTLELITAAEARDQQRLAEMNRTVLANLDTIINSLESPEAAEHAL
jgi:ferredoxin